MGRSEVLDICPFSMQPPIRKAFVNRIVPSIGYEQSHMIVPLSLGCRVPIQRYVVRRNTCYLVNTDEAWGAPMSPHPVPDSQQLIAGKRPEGGHLSGSRPPLHFLPLARDWEACSRQTSWLCSTFAGWRRCCRVRRQPQGQACG